MTIQAKKLNPVRNTPGGPQVSLTELNRMARLVERSTRLTATPPLEVVAAPTGYHIRLTDLPSSVEWFVVNGVSPSNSSYYDATLLSFTPGNPPSYPTTATNVWLATPQGIALTTGHRYPANDTSMTDSAQPYGGGSSQSREVWEAFSAGIPTGAGGSCSGSSVTITFTTY